MSIRDPLSDERTVMTWPTCDSRMVRISSISGPGQKLPRASTRRVAWGGESTRAVMAVSLAGSCRLGRAGNWLDEERRGAVGEELDDGRGPNRLAEPFDHVLTGQAEHVHRHLAGHELDPEGLSGFEQLLRAGDAVLLRQGAHHPRAHAQEVHLRELPVADAR